MDPVAWVARVSLDLRGIRPSLQELESAATGMEAAEGVVEAMVEGEGLGTRIAWLYDDHLRTAVFFHNSPTRDWSALDEDQLRAVGWAPLELVRWIVDEDQPLDALVLAPELPRNDPLAQVFGLAPTGTGDTWVMAAHDDDRPEAGLLSSSVLWLAYDGDRTNRHRRRANAVARIFLCDDLLARDLDVELDLAAEDLVALEDAVRTEPACLSCHAVLDPLAALFGGFPERSVDAPPEQLAVYSSWSAAEARAFRAPAAYGQPVGSLEQLGQVLAVDPRFARCATETLAGLLTGGEAVDPDQLDTWTRAFVEEDGLVLRPLVHRIVTDPSYMEPAERLLRPEQLPGLLAELLALDPEDEELQRLAWQVEHRLLGGSTDDALIIEPNHEPTVGWQVLLTWVARTVAAPALEADAERAEGDRRLWTRAEPWPTTQDSVRLQLADWHARFLSLPVDQDSPEVDRLLELWQATGGGDEPHAAWTVVVHALLRHPAFLIY